MPKITKVDICRFRILTFLALQAILILMTTVQVYAQGPNEGKSGVAPQVISLPSGPGSLEGLGEAFEPDLSTGTGSYQVKIAVAPGRAKFQPDLTLMYNGGNANSPFGLGWRLSIPYIQRLTDEGLPDYDDDKDRFIDDKGAKLVRIDQDEYRYETEGKFVRFRRLTGGGWEATTPSGVKYLYGIHGEAQVKTQLGIFRWHLEQQVDTHGNRIEYSYDQDGGYAYIAEIRYNFSDNGGYDSVRINYEKRADIFVDRRSRSPVAIARRATLIEVWALGKPVRSYRLTYMPEGSTGRHSLLQAVTQLGADGISALPPQTFTYTEFNPEHFTVVSMQNPPPVGLRNSDVDLVDINGDALPDMVHTSNNGHRFYLNQGHGKWQQNIIFPTLSPAAKLSSPNARMADMDGNGEVDFVVKSGNLPSSPFFFFAGQPGHGWERTDRVDYNLTPNFKLDEPNLRLLDVNNDKRIDFMLTTKSGYKVWLAHRDNTWSESADTSTDPLVVGSPLLFSNPKVKLADMTGDRLQDIVFVQDGFAVYFPHNGYGRYGEAVKMKGPPTGIEDQEQNIFAGDINNDGLADLILVGNRYVRYWLNRGDNSFTPEIVLPDTPQFSTTDTAVRVADMDGDGAMELLYSNSNAPANEVLQYVDFYTGTQPLLLTTINNGLGRTIQIEYKPSTDYYINDLIRDEPWTTQLPFPVQVVSRLTIHDANSGHEYITDYAYRDGYYDGTQKEFRGFAEVVATEHGDETAPTTVTRHRYDTGQQDESRKGLLLEQTVLGEKGTCEEPVDECYRRVTNQVTTSILHEGVDNRQVSYSFIKQTDTFIYENTDSPIHLREEFNRDDFGNLITEFNYGQVCDGAVTCGDDEILTYTDYAQNIKAWILNKPSHIRRKDVSGNLVSEARLHYDGEPFVGLPVGQVERGDLTQRVESLGPLGNNRFVPKVRQGFDEFGNVISILDANDNLTTVNYDQLVHTFPITEEIHLKDDHSLIVSANYDFGFGTITSTFDFNRNASLYRYDTFGRLTKIVLPGDTVELPTQQFTYTLGSPVSSISTAQRERFGEADVRLSITYFDGLGRKLQTRSEAENNLVVVADAFTYNARQSTHLKFLPYYDKSFAYAPPDPALPHFANHYDPMGRVVKLVNPDESFSSTKFQPLTELQYDEEDNDPGSPYFDTPKTLTHDGLDRLVMVQERNLTDGALEVYTTTYRYDPLGNLTRITDAQGNVKAMRYDALSRRLYMDDPDRGQMTYVYDDAGNVIETTDAKSQIVKYEYDGANRLTAERWVQPDGSLHTYAEIHYDHDLSPRHPEAENTLGKISYITDEAGEAYFSYDARGNTSGQSRFFVDENLEFVTLMSYDAANRLSAMTYPDGRTIKFTYNDQGLLESIPGFVDNIDYIASGQLASMHYANGVVHDYDYDIRLRMNHLQSTNGSTTLQDLIYTFDGNSNIVAIGDNRISKIPVNDQSQQYNYDALYRLINASGTYGQINYTYNSLGNTTSMTSTATDTRLNIGIMRYGENGAGPRALTTVGTVSQRYDVNGNLIAKGAATYTWDYRNQLRSAEDVTLLSIYIYDYDGQRTHQTVTRGNIVTKTLYASAYTELRGDSLVQYVFANGKRIAEFSVPLDSVKLLDNLTGNVSVQSPTSADVHWYVADHLGGTSLLTDKRGEVLSEAVYYPFGLMRYEHNGDIVRYGFTDKELDLSGLHYYGARYYNSITGRFISVDPLYAEHLENPQRLNVYAYTLNNPLRYLDPDGRDPNAFGLELNVGGGSCAIFCILTGSAAVGIYFSAPKANDIFFNDFHLYLSAGGGLLGITPGPEEKIKFLEPKPFLSGIGNGVQSALGLGAGFGLTLSAFKTEARTFSDFSGWARAAAISVGPVTGGKSENLSGQKTVSFGGGISHSWFLGGSVYNTYTVGTRGILDYLRPDTSPVSPMLTDREEKLPGGVPIPGQMDAGMPVPTDAGVIDHPASEPGTP